MRISKILLASVATLTAGAAVAADLPSKKSAPVEYVRVCSAYGEGFFYIPGTDTCVRVGGRAVYEYQVGSTFARGDSATGSGAGGRIFVDARTATEYGLLRAIASLNVYRATGQVQSGSQVRQGRAFTGTGVDFRGQAQTQVNLDRAFVQFGGLTAGRAESFFDFYAGDLEYVGTTAGSGRVTNLLAYTASFGTGFSATLSMEDNVERRNAIISPLTVSGLHAYTGDSMPDVVGALRVEQGWGQAQLSGAVHQVRTGMLGGFNPDTKYGYALNAGAKFNLPFSAGDALYLQGTYSKGASDYVVSNPFGTATATGAGVGGLGNLAFGDATVGALGKTELTTVWGLTAAALHYWTPTIRQGLFGSYIKVDQPTSVVNAFGGSSAVNYVRDFSYWTVGTNVTWSPVKDLDIGAEVDYIALKSAGARVVSANDGKLINSDNAVVGRIKIQRDF
ncbi:porin [Alsobacter soli]|uniref:Porin n=1 Tax=Alsobacter soli TaxID=2109933 RepID=A0A2T1HMC9_9HYPH|nr:porin [Alsobacter soli]PSC02739.1 porin [Alsobacter soli]